MWPESSEQAKPLRSGLTTGTCATACSVAAAMVLLGKTQPEQVFITLPKGQEVPLTITSYEVHNNSVTASTVKDAGDDPDVTHGATVWVTIALTPQTGIQFAAGQGVGIVTRTGLLLDVGEPAINPVPRKMISDHLTALAKEQAYLGGFKVTVGVEKGEQIALKTMNPRLGIVGGISILGTTGIVRPFSCGAYIASIQQGVDVARANGHRYIAATTGNASETAIRERDALEDMALIEMGDFIGALLKHVRRLENQTMQLNKLTICGGFGKISKLAQQHMDLNSRASSIDLMSLAELASTLGGSESLKKAMSQANTSVEALTFAQAEALPLADAVCQQALDFCRRFIPSHMDLEVLAIDRKGQFVGQAIEPKGRL
ncbi:cobalt-precorrin-6A synthase [Marinomonas gallaica]|uniref:Cobalt-precorrin-5B C(1)-methyltransferase n=1 Tax=Marinomonas gallaica TaxID=1806667 RepID=A0A1C3JSA7_9GAMM|nr:cobalt-precorrin-5B (C(1))-methyltransferase [Marinomonas gallaica]SBT18094.1 cobalt-precorrin-6A synthase [Marinomonas gallaica]SBT22474.1 cobalt-precorrin-6A synthase [Marinomonas gallaica]